MARAESWTPDTDKTNGRFVDVLRVRAFSVLYLAEMQSIVGDQVARIALAVLVFDRTGSAAASALSFACTFLPAIAGGAWLAGIGDRFSRRAVMVGCDVVRAALFALMAIPGLPLPVLFALLVLAVFIGPAFSASEVSVLVGTLDSARFRLATGLRMVTGQLAQVAGFAVGGAAVGLLDPRGALLVDAATYVISATLVGLLLGATGSGHGELAGDPVELGAIVGRARTDDVSPARWLWRQPRVRLLVAVGWLASCFVAPEGLAVPFAVGHGASTTQAGLLLAAIPLGGAFGAIAVARLVPPRARSTLALWMAVFAGIPLIATVAATNVPAACVLWGLSGVFAAYQVEVTTQIVRQIPDRRRAGTLGLVAAGLVGAQGCGLIVFGLVAQATSPGTAVAVAGGVGSVLALVLTLALGGLSGGSPKVLNASCEGEAIEVPHSSPSARDVSSVPTLRRAVGVNDGRHASDPGELG
ncbi:MAG: hypothetical protein QOD45_1917 [Pseudonocardiales bacterium]|nr:hypothetical protein [Pseudonocardiales bacterium]